MNNIVDKILKLTYSIAILLPLLVGGLLVCWFISVSNRGDLSFAVVMGVIFLLQTLLASFFILGFYKKSKKGKISSIYKFLLFIIGVFSITSSILLISFILSGLSAYVA